jgi:hypothetical protein
LYIYSVLKLHNMWKQVKNPREIISVLKLHYMWKQDKNPREIISVLKLHNMWKQVNIPREIISVLKLPVSLQVWIVCMSCVLIVVVSLLNMCAWFDKVVSPLNMCAWFDDFGPYNISCIVHVIFVMRSFVYESYQIFYDMTRKRWPFNTGGCLIEVTTWAGLTVQS